MLQFIETFLLLLNVVEQLFDVHGHITKQECSLSNDEILEKIHSEVADQLADLNDENEKGAQN